jgi:hypothetical protein
LLTYLLVAGLVLALLAGSLAVILAANPIAERQAYQRLELVGRALAQRESRAIFSQGEGRLRQVLARLDLPAARIIVVGPEAVPVQDACDRAVHPAQCWIRR